MSPRGRRLSIISVYLTTKCNSLLAWRDQAVPLLLLHLFPISMHDVEPVQYHDYNGYTIAGGEDPQQFALAVMLQIHIQLSRRSVSHSKKSSSLTVLRVFKLGLDKYSLTALTLGTLNIQTRTQCLDIHFYLRVNIRFTTAQSEKLHLMPTSISYFV